MKKKNTIFNIIIIITLIGVSYAWMGSVENNVGLFFSGSTTGYITGTEIEVELYVQESVDSLEYTLVLSEKADTTLFDLEDFMPGDSLNYKLVFTNNELSSVILTSYLTNVYEEEDKEDKEDIFQEIFIEIQDVNGVELPSNTYTTVFSVAEGLDTDTNSINLLPSITIPAGTKDDDGEIIPSVVEVYFCICFDYEATSIYADTGFSIEKLTFIVN